MTLPINFYPPNTYGMEFQKDGETLYLRMEKITAETTNAWEEFRKQTKFVALSSQGVLTVLAERAGTEKHPSYERIKKPTGFTEEEYDTFSEEAKKVREKTNDKVVKVLRQTMTGTNHMYTYFNPEEERYIVYVTKDPNFSILEAEQKMKKNQTLKNYIEAYNDLLITVGSDFGYKNAFQNRGISRNPHWVFKNKYSGLSMILHGFSAAVAKTYFPEKKEMLVKPVGSMQSILTHKLKPGDGFVEVEGSNKDITELSSHSEDSEGAMNHIQLDALVRIFNETITG